MRMPSRLPSYLFALVTFAACAAVFAAVAVVPAPPAVLPLAALICIGCPAIAAWQLRGDTLAAEHEPLAELRRGLAELPEVEHPLGL
jgi:hypothetical protein